MPDGVAKTVAVKSARENLSTALEHAIATHKLPRSRRRNLPNTPDLKIVKDKEAAPIAFGAASG
jgi:hypothetical protein